MTKYCKYCGTEISWSDWLFYEGACISCLNTIQERKMKKQKRDSERYWRKIK